MDRRLKKIYILFAFVLPIIVYIFQGKIKRGIFFHLVGIVTASISMSMITGLVIFSSFESSVYIAFIIVLGGYCILVYDALKIGKRVLKPE